MEREYLPTPPLLSLPQLPWQFFPVHVSLRLPWQQSPFDPLPIIVKDTLFCEFVSLGTIVVKQQAAKMTYME